MAPSKGSFQGLGLSPNTLKGLAQMGYRLPTPVQRRSLPHSLSGVDTVVMARTGSGKTAAFLIPLLEKLRSHSQVVGCRAIVMSPSRELALQTLSFGKKMSRFTGIRFALIVGGESMEKQFNALAANPDVIICTPGRLMHHLKEIKELSLSSVEMVVFDEADRLFEMGFAEQIREIMRTIPERRQNLLFSATMPPVLVQFARAGLMDPVLIRLDTDTKISDTLALSFFTVRNEDKPACLLFLLRQIIRKGDMTAIFLPTQHHVIFMQQLLAEAGMSSSSVYGALDQQARQENLECFRRGKTKFLLVTDVAARGIDIPLLNNVVNYSFPSLPKLFVHRVGRAARQGRPGIAFSFVAPDELPYMMNLYTYLGKEPISPDIDFEGYSVNEITPENAHYGAFPQCVLDDESEAVRQLILRSHQSVLQQLEKVALNAEKQYKRMRQDPEKKSIMASKQHLINAGHVHPMLRKFDGGKAELEKKEYINAMSNFRPKETIFEVMGGKGSGTSEDVMVALRKRNRLNRLLNSAAAKTNKSSSTQQQMTTTTTEGGNGSGLKLKLNGGDTAAADTVNTLSEGGDNTREGGVKDQHGDDEKEEEPPQGSAFNNALLLTQQKPHLSRAALNKLKKAQKQGKASVAAPAAAHVPPSSSSISRKGERKQRRRDKQCFSGKGPGAYADPEHFIGYGIDETTAMINASLEPRTVEKAGDSFTADRLAEAMLDVDPDEAVDLARKRRMLHWDPRKKKYIKTSLQELGESKKHKIRNEAGVLVSTQKDKPGHAYLNWKKKTHREVGSQGTLEMSARCPGGGGPHDAIRQRTGKANNMRNPMKGDDLRTREQIRQEKKKEENRKLKNSTKSKRRHLLQKKKNIYEAKERFKKQYDFKGKTRSRMLVFK